MGCRCVFVFPLLQTNAFAVLIRGVGKSCSWGCEQFRGSWMVEGVG